MLGISLAADSTAAFRWALNQGGEYYAVGRRGRDRRLPARLAIIDDPIRSREDAEFQSGCAKRVWDWYKSDPRPRMKPGGRQILIRDALARGRSRWPPDRRNRTAAAITGTSSRSPPKLSMTIRSVANRANGSGTTTTAMASFSVTKKRPNSRAIGRRSISRSRRPIRAIISRRNGSSPTMTHRRTRR